MVKDQPLIDFAREELLNWVELTVEEFQGLKSDGLRVEGEIAGRRFTLCTAENLPPLDSGSPVLLDIDVDYFQSEGDLIWQSPGELRSDLGLANFDVLTIAVSVDGGYTCLEHRYLAEVTELVFGDSEAALWEQRTQRVIAADRERDGTSPVYEGIVEPSDPDWFRAAMEMKAALSRGQTLPSAATLAEAIDSRYKLSSFNEALVHFRNKRFSESIENLEEDHDHLFMRGVIALQGGLLDLAQSSWEEFLETVEMGPLERAHALFLRGQTLIQRQELPLALSDFKLATKLDPKNFHYLLFYGLAQQGAGELKNAAKSWRRALSLQGDRVFSVELHLELSRLYRQLGRAALAEAELQRIQQKDKTGQYKMMIQMEHLRSAKPRGLDEGLSERGLWRTGMNMVGAL